MSLILEALRKSEVERRRGEMPDLRAELPPPASTQRAPLRRALPWIVVVAIACTALAFVLHPWSRDARTPAASQSVATTPAETIRMQPRSSPAIPPRIETPHIAEREAPKSRPSPQTATPVPPPAIAEVAPEPFPEPPQIQAATTDTRETPIAALPADLRKALPPLQLSMHMWDPDPAKRFVILDGERHVEGDSVGPMRIRRIDADGVLFDWQGRSIRLPLR